MKKVSVLPILVFACSIVLASDGLAQEVTNTSGDWRYVTEAAWPGSTIFLASLRAYTGNASNILIPPTLGGYPVNNIQFSSYSNFFFGNANNTIRSVSLPDSLVWWSPEVFYKCPNLTNVSVTSTNNRLTNMNGVLYTKQGDALVFYPPALPGPFAIPDSVKDINAHAFRRVNRLESVNVPDTVKRINDSAFAESPSLLNINIGNGVTNIGNGTFTDSTALTNITLGSSLVDGGNTFYDNGALRSIQVNPSNPFYSSVDGVLFDKSQSTLLAYPNSKADAYVIPSGVTSIGLAFVSRTNLRSITIPNSITNLGGAFRKCTSLTNITIPDTVTSFDAMAFDGCTALETVTIGKGITVVPELAFRGASKLRTITLLDTVKEIQANAFLNCTGLTNVTIGNGINNIGGRAFSHCSNLTTVIFRGNAPVAGLAAFTNTPATIYYLSGTTGWGPTYADRPTAMIPPHPNIIIEDSEGVAIPDNSSAVTFGSVLEGNSSEKRNYTIRNMGGANLTNLSITSIEGVDSVFVVAPPGSNVLPPISSSSFSVAFKPTTGGSRSSRIDITSNATNYGLFRINLSGFGIGTNLDTDSDGLNDAAEFTMRELGFDWQVNQTNLVNTLLTNASRARLYNETQYESSRSNGRNDVVSNPAAYNLYTSNSIMDLRMGGLMVQKQGSNAVVTFQPQISTDLNLPFTNNGTPITNTIPMPGNKGFIRINAKP
jgi:hypothetical protein